MKTKLPIKMQKNDNEFVNEKDREQALGVLYIDPDDILAVYGNQNEEESTIEYKHGGPFFIIPIGIEKLAQILKYESLLSPEAKAQCDHCPSCVQGYIVGDRCDLCGVQIHDY